MKKILFLFIALTLSVGLYSETVATPPTQGDGSEENPYQIENLAHLRWLSETNSVWDKHFIQTADIDAEETENWNDGEGFDPIGGFYSNPFTGTYNGNYHKIKNLYINRPDEQWIGLFGYTSRARIEKLSLEDVDIKAYASIGGIGGVVSNSSIIYQTSVTGNIESMHGTAGGISGQLNLSRIYESYSNAIIKAPDDAVGGIVGSLRGRIISCYSLSSFIFKGSLHPRYAGGIAGTEYDYITNCYYAGPGEIAHGISRFYDSKEKNTTNFWDSETSGVTRELSLSVKSQPHKWHIWFFPTHKPTLKKPKEPFFLPTHGRTDRQLFQHYLS